MGDCEMHTQEGEVWGAVWDVMGTFLSQRSGGKLPAGACAGVTFRPGFHGEHFCNTEIGEIQQLSEWIHR